MIARRRPTPTEAEHSLRALNVNSAKLRLYHRRRAAGICVRCERPTPTAYCPSCAADEKLSKALRRAA
jgi:hypothetical protein